MDCNMKVLDHEAVKSILPDREADAHKGDFGKILLLCGARGYTGAAYLAAMGALRSGAGLVFLGVPESIYTIEAVKLNEAIVFPLPDTDGKLSEAAIAEILQRLPEWMRVFWAAALDSRTAYGRLLRPSWNRPNVPWCWMRTA